MRILVVGGSGFLGGAITRAALAAGHEVTVLARGRSPIPPGATLVTADRAGPLPDLHGRFDAALDTSAFHPAQIDRLAAAVGDVSEYVLISSISVYDTLTKPGMDESAPARAATAAEIAGSTDPHSAAAAGALYGPLKRSCEIAAERWRGPRATALRVGLLIGPGDYTDRLPFWVRRIDDGGTVPVPAPPQRPIQAIDVDDVAAFALSLLGRDTPPALNVTGPVTAFGDLLARIIALSESGAQLAWHPLERFTAAGLTPWSDVPLVLPDVSEVRSMLHVSTAAARALGLSVRPVGDTLSAILADERSRGARPLRAGFPREREADILAGQE